MATRTLYGFDEDGNKIAVGSYDTSVTVTLLKTGPQGPNGADSGYYSVYTLTGAGTYDIGDSVTIESTHGLSAHADFYKWVDEQGNLISYNNPYTFIVTENTTIYAYYNTGGGN